MALSKITTLSITDDNVTLAKLGTGTQGDILYYAASGAPTRLGFGTSGDFLKTQGTGANPAWATAAGGKILQVVTGSNSGKASSSSGSYVSIFTSPSITPSATSSDIIVMFNTIISQSDNNGNGFLVVKRDGSTLIGADPIIMQHFGSYPADWQFTYFTNYGGATVLHDTAISTTSAVDYQIMVKDDGSGLIVVGGRDGDTEANQGVWWTLMEVDWS